MQELVTWLKAQLDEDEQAAKAACGGEWSWQHGYGEMCNDPDCNFGQLMAQNGDELWLLMDVHGYDARDDWWGGPHIARHDPARTMREVESKRQIINLAYSKCGADSAYADGWDDAALWAVKALALPYADRPGYRAEWRP